MDKSREAFEKWYRAEYWDFKYDGVNGAPYDADNRRYSDNTVQLAWASFQACYNHTLEEAAKVCDDLYLNHKAATNESADAIRALKTQEGK